MRLTNENELRLLLLREKRSKLSDADHEETAEMEETTGRRRGGRGCGAVAVAVPVVRLLCCWTLYCTTNELVDSIRVHSST